MKLTHLLAKALLVLTLLAPANLVLADQPSTIPPRGHAYGYYLKDGEKVLFIYMIETGARVIELSNCRPNRQYLVESSVDLKSWSPMVTLRAGVGGTASCTDTRDLPYCFYRVTNTN